MHTSEVLNRAADLIEERGWTTGIFGWGDLHPEAEPGLCLEGGIAAAMGIGANPTTGWLDTSTLYACPAYRAVADHLGADHVYASGWLWPWNDAPGRTAAEVIEVLRATAVIEAARENATERVSA